MSSTAPFVPKHPANYGSHILHELAEFQESCLLTDFILSSQGHEIHCHRSLLASACPYFKAMFSSGMKEAGEGKAVMDYIDYAILKYVVHFMYGKSPSLYLRDVDKLVEACEFLQLNELKKQLDVYIAGNVMAENCVTWWKIAEKFHLEVTGATAKSIMISEIQKVSRSEDFTKLTYAELVDYIHTVEESVSNPEKIFHAMIQWIIKDTEERKSLMIDILNIVKLEECSAASIIDVTKTHRELFTDPNVKCLMYQSVLLKLEKSESKPKSFRTQSVLLLGGMSHVNGKSYTECWKWSHGFSNGSWNKITDIPNAAVCQPHSLFNVHNTECSRQPSFVLTPQGFAVICGSDSGSINSQYDLKNGIWTDLPDTPENLTDTVALYVDGKVHVLDGGQLNGPVTTDKMYILNLKDLKWSRGPDLLEKQYRPIATAYENALWVVYNDDNIDTMSPCSFQQLAPKAHKWEYKASLPAYITSRGASLVGYKDDLYLMGGYRNVCARYAIGTDQWTRIPSIHLADHEYGSVFVLNQKIYVCGGGRAGSDFIAEYDPDADHWTAAKNKLPREMTFFTAFSICDDTAN